MAKVGLLYDPTIRGVHYTIPVEQGSFNVEQEIRGAVSRTMTGRANVDRTNADGAGLPDVLDVYEFMLAWRVDNGSQEWADHLETLRVTPGPHDFAYWRKRFAHYTVEDGQVLFYLPRADAYGQAYSGRDSSDFMAEVTLNDVAVTVTYETVVDEATVVAAGSVAIASEPVMHSRAGYRVCPFKFGDAIAEGDVVVVKYHPLFSVEVASSSTKFPFAGVEDTTLILVEVN